MPRITATPARSARALAGTGRGRRRCKAFVVAASCLALTMTLLPTAVASAEPDRTATLNRADPKFTWESSGTGVQDPTSIPFGPELFRCTGAPFNCEYILLDVGTVGELTLTLVSTEVDPSDPTGAVKDQVKDIDGYLYRSNAAGEPLGKNLTNYDCVTPSSSEKCKVAVAPGFYVLEVEYYKAVEASYRGAAELDPATSAPPAAAPQMITLEGCNFTLYRFKDSAERLQALVPPGYRVRPYEPYLLDSPLMTTQGSATIAAAAYDCDNIEVPGWPAAPGIFTVLSVLVYPPDGTAEGPAFSDFYVLGVHANNPQLVKLLASRGMPADLVPGMSFEKRVQSLGVRVEVPWSQGAYALEANGFFQDVIHDHDNTYVHGDGDGSGCTGDGAQPGRRGCVARMDFVTSRVRDQSCSQVSDDHHAVECGKLTAEAGTPVARFFGASDRSADDAFDHERMERSWLILQ